MSARIIVRNDDALFDKRGHMRQNNGNKRAAIAGGIVLVFAAIALAGFIAFGGGSSGDDGADNGMTIVRGVIGSEKEALFEDPESIEIFNKHGIDVQVTTSGSWAMSDKEGLTDNDFAFPSSELAAQHIEDSHGDAVVGSEKPFYSPLAIATGKTQIDLLAKNGIAYQDDGVWHIDMQKYIDAVNGDVRWNSLDGADAYPSSRSIMITTTDVRTSNSAEMFLALASYVANGNAVISSSADASAQAGTLSKLFLDQGYQQSSSAGPWEQFLSKGTMNQPLTLIYESQFLEEQLSGSGRISDDMVIAYPSPTIFSDHVMVAFSEEGTKVTDILMNDPDMAKVIARHGFRINGANSSAFDEALKAGGLSGYADDATFIDNAVTPSYEVLDTLINEISSQY